ncbi:MAG: hypothetical protein AAGL24_06480 [Pseudomonadota bacterium]
MPPIACFVAVLWLAALLAGSAKSEDTLDEAHTLLTGSDKRTWIELRIEKFMGQGCIGGSEWTFFIDGRVRHDKCLEGHLKSTWTDWSMTDLNSLDRELRVGEDAFIVLFQDGSDGLKMRLRQQSSSKAEATVDIVLSSDE